MITDYSKYYYNIKSLCDFYKIDHTRLLDSINNSNKSFMYKNDAYITIDYFYSLCYKLQIYNVLATIAKYAYKVRTLYNSINHIIIDNNVCYYVYIVHAFTKLKIGYSGNVRERLITLKSEISTNCNCVALFRYNTQRDAYLVEQMLLDKFYKHRLKGEWFGYNESIIEDANKFLINNLVTNGYTTI